MHVAASHLVMSPSSGSGDILFFPMHPSVSVTKSCESNSSYGFSKIFLTLCRCFCLGLKICMTFCCNPRINFCCFFRSLNLVIFGLKSFRHWVSCERKSSYSFNRIFLRLSWCLCQGLNMCMPLCCNPHINIFTFFPV